LLSLADSEMLRESLLSQAQIPSARRAFPSEYTRFEKARILGARALQVSLGAPILVEIPAGEVDPVAIAEREFEASMIPITVRRGSSPPE
jgi:DNA-directed RNA polymerase subunit K